MGTYKNLRYVFVSKIKRNGSRSFLLFNIDFGTIYRDVGSGSGFSDRITIRPYKKIIPDPTKISGSGSATLRIIDFHKNLKTVLNFELPHLLYKQRL